MAEASTGKASSGDPFKPPSAVIWNNMVDAGRAWADERLNGGGGIVAKPRATDIIRIKNTSGAARRLGEILRIEDKALFEIQAESIWLKGVVPTATGYFGILRERA